MLGIERVGEAGRRRHHVGIVEHDLARIDVADAVGVLHRRDQVRGVRHLRIVELLDQALLVHVVHVVGRQALHVGRAAPQRPSRPSSWPCAGRRSPRRARTPSPWAPAAACRCSWSAAANSRRPRCRRCTFLSCAAAGKAASAAAPASAVRRLIMKAMAKSPLFPEPPLISSEHLAGRRLPADMNRLPDLGREAAVAVGDLHHQPVGWATGAHGCRSARRDRRRIPPCRAGRCRVLPAARARFRAARAAATGRRLPGRAAGAGEARPPSVRKRPGASTVPARKVRAADEARHEAVGRPLVEVALAADLVDRALVHHHQPVGHGERLLLVVGHHHRGEAELALQLADLDPHLLAQLGVEVGERLVEQQHVGPDGERAGQRHALLLAARELARQAARR